MLRYVCDMCGATADEVLPSTWATALLTIPPPPIMEPLIATADEPFPPRAVPAATMTTKHICEKHRGEAAVTLRWEGTS